MLPTIKAFLLFHFSNPDELTAFRYGSKASFKFDFTLLGRSKITSLMLKSLGFGLTTMYAVEIKADINLKVRIKDMNEMPTPKYS